MNLNDCTLCTRTTAIYPSETAITYLTLGLASEAGEVAGKLKKQIRDGQGSTSSFLSELGDVLWYTVEDLATMNNDKLVDRQQRDVFKGSGDNR